MKKQQDKPWRMTKEEYEQRRLALLAELGGGGQSSRLGGL